MYKIELDTYHKKCVLEYVIAEGIDKRLTRKEKIKDRKNTITFSGENDYERERKYLDKEIDTLINLQQLIKTL